MTYFVEGFDPSHHRALLVWAQEEFDPGDRWGWTMSWLFDVANELFRRGEEVPEELQFRPSPMGPDVSEDRAEGLQEISTEALLYGARVLNRFDDQLRQLGENY